MLELPERKRYLIGEHVHRIYVETRDRTNFRGADARYRAAKAQYPYRDEILSVVVAGMKIAAVYRLTGEAPGRSAPPGAGGVAEHEQEHDRGYR